MGRRSGESTRLSPIWPGFKSWLRRHMCLEFVVGSLFTRRGFSPGTLVFPTPQKLTLLNSNSTRNQVDEEPLCGCATSKSLFYLFISIYLFKMVNLKQPSNLHALVILSRSKVPVLS